MTRGREMADYRKMYTVLCGAIDDVIDDLAQIPKARQSMLHLQRALQQAEDIYIETTVYWEDTSQTIIELQVDCPPDEESRMD